MRDKKRKSKQGDSKQKGGIKIMDESLEHLEPKSSNKSERSKKN